VKYFLVITVFLAVLAETFSKDLIVAHFYLNRAYITRNFCENRDKPQLHCNGKCQLRKKLQKENKQEKAIFQNDKHDITLFCEADVILPVFAVYFSPQKYFTYNVKRKINFSSAIFHPPTLVI